MVREIQKTTIDTGSFSFVIVDCDGDGKFNHFCQGDHLELPDGTFLKSTDPRVQTFFEEIGSSLYLAKIDGIKERQKTIRTLEKKLSGVKNEEETWKVYQEYQSVLTYNMHIGSRPFDRFMDMAGKYGCHVTLRMAKEAADNGFTRPMYKALEETARCGNEHSIHAPDFAEEIRDTRAAGALNAVNGMLGSTESYLENFLQPSMREVRKVTQGVRLAAIRGGVWSSELAARTRVIEELATDIVSASRTVQERVWQFTYGDFDNRHDTGKRLNALADLRKYAVEKGVAKKFGNLFKSAERSIHLNEFNSLLAEAEIAGEKDDFERMETLLNEAMQVNDQAGLDMAWTLDVMRTDLYWRAAEERADAAIALVEAGRFEEAKKPFVDACELHFKIDDRNPRVKRKLNDINRRILAAEGSGE